MHHHRNLGRSGPRVGAVGYGAMGLEGYYGATDEKNAIDVIQHALDTGCSMIDTADAYGNGHNERLICRAVTDRRDKVFVATKFGIALVPWSPLGGGFLTGTIDQLGADDFRNNNPRFQGEIKNSKTLQTFILKSGAKKNETYRSNQCPISNAHHTGWRNGER